MNLEPLRRALQAETEAETARRRDEVGQRCAAIVAAAESTAHDVVAEGRAEGERAATAEAGRRAAAATRRARELWLGARARQLDALRSEARERVPELRSDERYGALLERLTAAARAQLGDAAELAVDPEGLGGVIGRRGSVSVDYTLPTLVDRVIDDLGTELDELWR